MFRSSRKKLLAALAAGFVGAVGAGVQAQETGPSTSVEPYVLPAEEWTSDQVKTISILTVGEGSDGYRLVGIPDGTGAFNNKRRHGEDKSFTWLVNHELGSTAGVVRAHGSKGAFVSRWTLDPDTLEVLAGQDFTQSADDVYNWDRDQGKYVQGTTAWQRFCSGDLPEQSAFQYSNKGTSEKIYLAGEETNAGRAYAHIATGEYAGTSWELPRLGKLAWENALACPKRQTMTIVACMDDAEASTSPLPPNVPSELCFYVGEKQKSGNPIERAGLTNGTLWGIKVTIEVDGTEYLVTEESDTLGLGGPVGSYVGEGRFELVELGDYSAAGESDATLQADCIANDILRMQRIEDGAWDVRGGRQGDLYFLTTASFTTNSRLWLVSFDDIRDPADGGTIEILLKGDEGQKMLDNMCIDTMGRVLLQEDVGNQSHLGKIWLYDTEDGDLVTVGIHNEKFFTGTAATNPDFRTLDEESSGIIDAKDILGRGWYLLDVQSHKNLTAVDPELVQDGQLLALYVDPKLVDDEDEEDDDDN